MSDNQAQATPGMRASLVSREVIADSIELMGHAHDFDALVCLVGCDKTVPAALMALARLDKPAVLLYSGPMRAGHLARPRADHPGRVGGRRGLRARRHPRADLDALERSACPGPGTCAGHFTASTMAIALECLGLAVVGDGLIGADADRREARGRRPRGAPAPALAAAAHGAHLPRPPRAAQRDGRIAATGGSTNGVLHLLAIAPRRASRSRSTT